MKPHELVAELVRRAGGSLPVAKAMRAESFQGTLHKFCGGKVDSPSRKTAERIARHFGIPIEAIYDEREASKVARERLGLDVALPPPPKPPADFRDRREVSDSDWGLLEDVKLVLSDQEISDIRARAQRLKEHAERYYRPNLTVVSNPLSQELRTPVIDDRSSPVHDKALGALEAAQIDPPVKGKSEQKDRESGRSTRPRHRGGP